MKKNKALFFLSGINLAFLVCCFFAPNYNMVNLRADNTCNHKGYRYDGKELTVENYGVKPFYVCCKCHEHFIDDGSTISGDWTPATLKDDQFTEIISYKDDRLIKSPFKALESQDEFYNYFRFLSWGNDCIPGKQMQIKSNNLYLQPDTILTEIQELGYNFLKIKMHIDSPDARVPKRIVAFHGGGAADKNSFADIDSDGNAILTIDTKSYLYNIDNNLRHAVNLFVSDNLDFFGTPDSLTGSDHCIKACTWTINEVTPVCDFNIEKGIASEFNIKYDENGVISEFSFVDVDVDTSVGWNGEMFKIKQSYWSSMYDKGYRTLIISPSFDTPSGAAGGIFNFSNSTQIFLNSGQGAKFELTAEGLNLGFSKVNHGNGRHYAGAITYSVILAKNDSEVSLKTTLASTDNTWRYFNFGAWSDCNPGYSNDSYMSFIGGNINVTNNIFVDLKNSGFTHFEFDVEITLANKNEGDADINRWVYTTQPENRWDLVYSEGIYNGKTHIDMDFSKAIESGDITGLFLYFRGRVVNESGVIIKEAPDCVFKISNVSVR